MPYDYKHWPELSEHWLKSQNLMGIFIVVYIHYTLGVPTRPMPKVINANTYQWQKLPSQNIPMLNINIKYVIRNFKWCLNIYWLKTDSWKCIIIVMWIRRHSGRSKIIYTTFVYLSEHCLNRRHVRTLGFLMGVVGIVGVSI